MKKKKQKFNTHHLVQRCDNGANHPCNLVKMDKGQHLALHVLFGEHCTLPIDKIRMIVEMHRPVLSIQFVKQITDILDFWSKQGRDAYNPYALSRRCRLKKPKT